MNIFQKVITEPLEQSMEKIIALIPGIMTSLLLIVVGVALGMLLKGISAKILKTVGLDKLAVKLGLPDTLKKGGIASSLSVLFSRLIGWTVVLIFAVFSLKALDISTLEHLFEKLFLYLPNIFAALLILLAGYVLGNFSGRAALIASVNAGLRLSGIVGGVVKVAIFILAATMALEQLGIGSGTVVVAFAILFGGVVLALAIAFGLGGRDMAKDYLEKKLQGEKESEDNGISHL
jgi:hypothetical protein